MLLKAGIDSCVVDYAGGGATSFEGVIRFSGSNWARLLKLARLAMRERGGTIVHMHVSAMRRFRLVAPILLLLFRHQHRVVTIHSGSFVRSVCGAFMRRYIRWLLSRFDRIIVVAFEQKNFLLDLGIEPRCVQVIPAFLPEHGRSEIGQAMAAQLPAGKRIILTSGYLTPLYNYDVLLDCVERLPANAYHAVFVFYNDVDSAYEERLLKRIGLLANVTVIRDLTPPEFLEVLRRADIYVRATFADGDSVAIREAIALGAKVFASAVVARPAECDLFEPNDPQGLMALFRADMSEGAGASTPMSTPDYFGALVCVYREACGLFDNNCSGSSIQPMPVGPRAGSHSGESYAE